MRLTFAGYFGFGNWGDEMILAAAIGGVRRRHPGVELTVLSGNPGQTEATFGVRAVDQRSAPGVLGALWRTDALCLFGGTLQDQTSFRSLAYYLSLAAGAVALGKPAVLQSVGVESLRRSPSRALAKLVLSSPRVAVRVRDDESKRVLTWIGVPGAKVSVEADLVFGLAPEDPRPVKAKVPPLIVPRLPFPDDRWPVYRGVAAAAATTGENPIWMFLQPSTDSRWLALAGARGLSTGRVLGPPSGMELPAGTGAVISSRYHALVLAACLGRPFVGLGDQGKVRRLCAQFSMPFIPWSATSAEATMEARRIIDAPRAPDRRKVEELRDRALKTAELDNIADLCRSSTNAR